MNFDCSRVQDNIGTNEFTLLVPTHGVAAVRVML